ncbi:aspartyl aminopeptidase [Morchella snyderi]|nr:aspartyl aminopeptidase [Morchella snyderi]
MPASVPVPRPVNVLRTAPSKSSEIVPDDYSQPFLDFINKNPTVFHAVDFFAGRLESAGFSKLSERDTWSSKLKRGGKYYTTRNGSALMAFTIPTGYAPGNGAGIVVGHIDALTAKLKPVSKKPDSHGYVQLGVAPYAGALNSTWWDRDLGVGGRVIVKNTQGKIESKLVKLDYPIARIPTLAPHFGIGGPFNKETQMVPIIGLESPEDKSSEFPEGSFVRTQPPRLVKAIAKELDISNCSSIINWELELFDTQPGQLGGLSKELLFAPRIDDKLCSYSALEALIFATSSKEDLTGSTINLVGLFDDEEIGSKLRQGAASNLMSSVIERVVEAFSETGKAGANVISQTYANSFMISADVTHAVNPNFLSAYLTDHMPQLNVGLTIGADSNGHLTTDAVSTAFLARVAEKSGNKLQVFQIRNDTRSGGTVGPMLSSATGIRSIDAGLAQLSMHSIRATCGSKDPGLGVKIFAAFFEYFEEVDKEFAE